MKNILILAAIAAGVCLSPIPSAAQFQVTIAPGTPGATIIADGGPGDTDPAPNAIGFETQIVINATTKFIASGHAIQLPGAGKVRGVDTIVGFDSLTLSNNAGPVTSTIIVQTGAFPAIGPPFNGRVHLDGKFKAFKGGNVQNASVSLSGSVSAPLTPIGTINIPAAVNAASPVVFGPPANPDVVKKLPIGATGGSVTVEFTLGVDDRISMVGSAFLAGYTADRAFVVNSTADLPDGLPGDGVCDTGSASTGGFTGICTLRAALTEADQQPVVTAIQFNIPGSGVPVIKMSSDTSFNFGSMGALQQVIVDGTTQPGAGLVEVDGSNASVTDIGGSPIVGLDLVGQKSAVLGLIVNGFPSHAIQIRPSGAPFGGSNIIKENFIGTDVTGLGALPNGGDAVRIVEQPDNLVQDNLIANNGGHGVSVDGSAATGNAIHANSITANADGIFLTDNGNNTQTAPVLTAASEDGSDLTIAGTLQSAPSSTFSFDIFVNIQCDSSGSGEGKTFLGSTSATTDATGNVTFTATLPANASEGLVATATATDPSGNTSEFSACAAVQQVPPTTQPPVANAGSNQTVSAGTLVMLNGSGSSDPNVPPLPLTFLWTQTAGPSVTLTGANTAMPSFTPPQAGTYMFSLVVNNGVVSSTAASVTVTVTATTHPPLANAGPNQTVSTGTLVTLNGSGSSDPNVPPLPLTYLWTQTAGPTATLTGANTAKPTFTPTQAGTYKFSLVVNNGVANSVAAIVTITAVTPQPQQLIEELIAEVKSLDLPKQLEKHLVFTLEVAEHALNHAHARRAIDKLRAFIDEVREIRGRRIHKEQVDKLIAAARQIIESIKARHEHDD
jgi:CSLREA domain-containing protein